MCPLFYALFTLPVILFTFIKSILWWGSSKHPTRLAFLHPYCAAGGGGERVLWQCVAAIQTKYPTIDVFVYTGDRISASELTKHVRDTFNIELIKPIQLVYLHSRPLLEARFYPFFTIAGQLFGSIVLGFEALLRGCRPHILIDTMGYSFTYPIFKCFQRCHVISYTHYPIVSSDMLQKVVDNSSSFNNRQWIAKSMLLSKGKQLYYFLLAQAYALSGWFADRVMVNSSWTKNHINLIWKQPHRTSLLFPPVDVKAFTALDLQSERRNKLHILSVAQFRPEKNHQLQLQVFAELLQKLPNFSNKNEARLLLIGSVRNEDDQKRVNYLKAMAQQLNIESQVEFHLNVSFEKLIELMQTSGIGLHTMKDEHFGIGIVECMAAGLVMLAHNSAGPKQDIIEDGQTGFLASDCEEYVQKLLIINSLNDKELNSLRAAARLSTKKFSNEQFDVEFLRIVAPFLSNEYEMIHSVRL